MAVTAQAVKELRQRTGLPMMECKKALTEADGDVDKAVEALRKAGAKAVDKLADRAATEGSVAAWRAEDGRRGAMVAVCCETEPVTKNELFQAYVQSVLDKVVSERPADVEALKALPLAEGTVEDGLRDLVNRIRENFMIGRMAHMEADAVVQYTHFDGKKGAMVAFKGAGVSDEVEALGRDICMHIVFTRPTALRREDVPADEVEKEREILLAAAKADPKNAKKPDEILKKIIEGQLGKFYQGRCLLEQPYVKDDKKTVAQFVKDSGLGLEVVDFAYLATDQ